MNTSSSVGVRKVRLFTSSDVAPGRSPPGSVGRAVRGADAIRPVLDDTASTPCSARSLASTVRVLAVDLGHDDVLADGTLEHVGGALGHQAAAGR